VNGRSRREQPGTRAGPGRRARRRPKSCERSSGQRPNSPVRCDAPIPARSRPGSPYASAAARSASSPPSELVLSVTGVSVVLMELQEVILRRRMVRRFADEPVSPQSLDRILHNAVRGPSAGFSQGQAFLVLTAESLPPFWEVASEAVDTSVRTAPLVIVPLSSKRIYLDRYAEPDKGWTDRDEGRWPVPFWHIDTGMATLLILLTVVDEGLGALYFGIVPEAVEPLREAFGIPADHEPIGAIAIGHDADSERLDFKARRRPLADMVHYGQW
jgi:nitroreductase